MKEKEETIRRRIKFSVEPIIKIDQLTMKTLHLLEFKPEWSKKISK